MADLKDKVALIIGVGAGLSASIARTYAKAGMKIALAARTTDDLGPLAAQLGAATFAADAADAAAVKKLFADVAASVGDRSFSTRIGCTKTIGANISAAATIRIAALRRLGN